MNHFMDTVMNPVVHLRLDQTLKAIHNFFLFIQFHCTDFYDFERQRAVEPAFTVLIPAESGHNHTSVSYTHLDVYKRQHLSKGEHYGSFKVQ